MDIILKERVLKKCANDDRKMLREFGKIRAEKIKLRLLQLSAAQTLEDVRNLAGRWHELTGSRKGQWACDLDGPFRLIFIPVEEPIPVDKNNSYIWKEIKGVKIIEILNYHEK